MNIESQEPSADKSTFSPYRRLILLVSLLLAFLLVPVWFVFFGAMLYSIRSWGKIELSGSMWLALLTSLIFLLVYGGIGYMKGRQWCIKLLNTASSIYFFLTAAATGALYTYAFLSLSSSYPLPNDKFRPSFQSDLTVSLFVLATFLLLLSTALFFFRRVLWKPTVLQCFGFDTLAAQPKAGRSVLCRMVVIGIILFVAAIAWVLVSFFHV